VRCLSKTFKSILLAGILAASSLEASPKAKAEAMSFYNLGQFQEAKERFLELSRANPQDPELNFYLGRSALEVKDYDTAIAAFDRVLMVDPAHARTRLEVARVYFERGYFELALKELDLVLSGKLPVNVRESVQSFRDRIEKGMSRHTWSAALLVGIEHDSNVNNDIGGKSFILPSLQLPLEGNTQKSDYNSYQGVILNHAYDMGERGGWAWESGLSAFNKSYFDQSANNLSLASLTTGPAYAHGSHKLSFPVSFDKIYLGSEGYVDVLSGGVKYKQAFSASWMGEAGILGRANDYVSKYRTRDSKEIFTYLGSKIALGEKNPWLFSLYVSHRDVNAKENIRTDVNLNEWSYKAELSKELWAKTRASVGYVRKESRYQDYDTLFLSKRDDSENRYELGLTYEISQKSLIGLSYANIHHRSNHGPFTYDKETLAAYYVWNFW